MNIYLTVKIDAENVVSQKCAELEISIEIKTNEINFKGYYTYYFYYDDLGMGYDFPCLYESLYFNAIRGGEIIAEKVQFKIENYNAYGNLNGIYGPYTTFDANHQNYTSTYGLCDPENPDENNYILISFEGTDYRFKYSEMTIERTSRY